MKNKLFLLLAVIINLAPSINAMSTTTSISRNDKKEQSFHEVKKERINFSDIKTYNQKIENYSEVYITGDQLKENRQNLENLLKNNPDLLVTLDVSTGGFVDNDGNFRLKCGGKNGIPKNIRHLKITGAEKAKRIDNYFLFLCKSLNSLELSSLENVKTIGGNFLYGCSSLKSINWSSLCNVEEIENCFLCYCESLNSIDLSPFKNVKYIGNSFLFRCKSIKTIDLYPLSNIERIGVAFLKDCHSIESIDISPLSKLTWIPSLFLSNLRSLKSIDLSPLSNVTAIGGLFLANCRSLKSVDLSPLSNVNNIGGLFLENCKSLKSLNLSGLKNLETIPGGFLENCSSLIKIDLSMLSKINLVGNSFLKNCNNVKELILPDSIKNPNNKNISGTQSLSSLLMKNKNKYLKNLGRSLYFKHILKLSDSEYMASDLILFDDIKNFSQKLKNKSKVLIMLAEIEIESTKNKLETLLHNNPNLSVIIDVSGPTFPLKDKSILSHSSWNPPFKLSDDKLPKNIKRLKIIGAENIENIDSNFLKDFNSLIHVDISSMKKLKEIEDGFLKGCVNIKELILPNFEQNKNTDAIRSLSSLLMVTGNEYLIGIGRSLYLKYVLNLFEDEYKQKDFILFSDIGDYSQKIKDKKEVIITGAGLLENRQNLENLLKNNTELLVTLDVSTGGFIGKNDKTLGLSCDRDWAKAKKGHLPLNIKHLKIVGAERAIAVDSGFLSGFKRLKSIDLSSLRNVKIIDDYFLHDCSSLTSIDLSPFKNVKEIRNSFLSGCKSIKSINLSPLSNVSKIGLAFLKKCQSIKSIDLSPLSKLTWIPGVFLSDCTSLQKIDLSALSKVTGIGWNFLANCSSLESVNISKLTKLTYVQWGFLKNCNNVKELLLPSFGKKPSDEVRTKVIAPIAKSLQETRNTYLHKVASRLSSKYSLHKVDLTDFDKYKPSSDKKTKAK